MARPRTVKSRNLRLATLGQAIALVIAESDHLTMDTVVAESGLAEKQIGTYIRGQGNPTYMTLDELCKGLHVSLTDLQFRADEIYKRLCGRSGQSDALLLDGSLSSHK